MSIEDYTWYNIFNLDDFEAEALSSKTYEVNLTDVGLKSILVTKGNYTSVLFDDIFLTINLNGYNPFTKDDRGVYIDENNDVWVGILDED